jgi:hypothetical protein
MFGGGFVIRAHEAWRFGVESYRTVSDTQDASGVVTRATAVQVVIATRIDF